MPDFLHGSLLEVFLRLDDLEHLLVEIAKPMIAEFVVVDEVPLTAGILVTPAITLTGKVNPFGMTKLIAHEIEVATVDGSSSYQTYHLVERDATVNHLVLVALLEVPVHIGIDEAEDDSLVAHQCLVVTLTVTDGLLIGTAVFHLPEDGTGFPVLVAQFLDSLNPVVGDIHGQTVVKTYSAVFIRKCQARHSAHLLGNGDGFGLYFVYQGVSQGEIANSIVILRTVVVVAIASEDLSQSVAVIHHGCYAIEAETIKAELLKPVFAVGKQEVYHFIFAIVEAKAVPSRMFTTVARTEILTRVATKVS